jgi:hypothetical protein
MRRAARAASAALLLLLVLAPGSALAQAAIVGVVARVRAEATIVAGAALRPAEPGAAVMRGEVLRTGPDARLEVRLNDGTVLTLGESAALSVDDYAFDLVRRDGTARLRLIEGVFRFVTGRIGSLPRHDLAVQSPVATIGIRGTDVWGGPIDGAFSVFLLSGRVEVTTTAGAAVLDRPGQGVTVPAPDQPPGPVVIWGADKRARAIATVSF